MGSLGSVIFCLAFIPLGACIGSFLNVVIYRLPYRESLVNPPSHCPHCNTLIPFRYNIPVLGWLIIGGRSKCCGKKVSARYPLIELLCGVLWGLIALSLKDMPLAMTVKAGLITFYLLYFSVLLAITFIDFDLQIIPDELDLGGLAVAVAASAALPQLHPEFLRMFPAVSPALTGVMGSLAGALVGGGSLWLITVLGNVVMRSKIKKLQEKDPEVDTVMGLGDVKLLAFIGAATGPVAALIVLFLGCLLGGIVGGIQKICTGHADAGEDSGLLSRVLQRWNSGESLMPFGPYLCSASLILFFFSTEIMGWFRNYFSPVIHLAG